MITCCYNSNYNTTINSNCSSVQTIFVCMAPLFCFLCIPFTIISLLIIKSRSLTNKNRRRRRINPSAYALRKGRPDTILRECCICQDEIKFRDLITLQCHHYFHQSCLQKWFRYKAICPICRNDFRLI